MTWNKEKKRAIVVFYPVFFSVLVFLLYLRYPASTVYPKDIHGIYLKCDRNPYPVGYLLDIQELPNWVIRWIWPLYILWTFIRFPSENSGRFISLIQNYVPKMSKAYPTVWMWFTFKVCFNWCFFKIYSYCFLELMERMCWSSYNSFSFNEQNKVEKCKIMSMKKIQPNHIIVREEGILFKQITRRDCQYLWKAYTHEWLLPVYFTGTGPGGSCNEQWNPVNIVNFR